MTVHSDRIDLPTMGAAHRRYRDDEAERRAEYWKTQYEELLHDVQTLVINLQKSDKPVRVVLGQISLLAARVEEPAA